MNIGLTIRAALSNAIANSELKRSELCAKFFDLTQNDVGVYTLNAWTAESKDRLSENIDHNGNKRWSIPAEMIPAFCHATGNYSLLEKIVEACGFKLVDDRDYVRAQLGTMLEKKKKLMEDIKTIEKTLKETS